MDGVSKRNTRSIYVGFCIIDYVGNFIYESSTRIEDYNNLYIEVVACENGIEFCIKNNLLPVLMKTYYMTLMNMEEAYWDYSWRIKMKIDRINHWKSKGVTKIQLVLREENKQCVQYYRYYQL